MRSRVTALALAVLTVGAFVAAFTPGTAKAQSSFPGSAVFSAYAHGTKQHVRVVDAGGQTLANVDTSFSGATTNSQGLTAQLNNTFNEPIMPVQKDKNAYARSAAAEVSLGATFPAGSDPSQIILPSLLEAAAAPTTALLRKDLVGPIQGDPLLYIAAATDKSQAVWNPNFCPLGQPISYGENDLAEADLINAGSTPFPGGNPLVSATPSGDYTTTNFNQSYTYLYPNGNGTFGVGSVNRQVFAPLTIGKGLAPGGADLINLTLLGTWQLRVENSGTGAPTVTYAAYDTLGNKLEGATAVATLAIAGTPAISITAQQIFGPTGFSLDIPPGPGPYLAQLHIGNPPTAIAGKPNAFTTDAIRLTALNVPGQITVADVAYGHTEAQASAPAGGIECNIPVTKTFLDASGAPVNTIGSGQNFSWKITFPSVDIAKELNCDLTHITVTDVASVVSGNATANITSASNGGTITGAKIGPGVAGPKGGVTWALPDYHPGDPPVILTIGGNIPATSAAGVIQNVANVHATLGNCKGGAAGQAFVNNASIGGKAATINGSAVAGVGAVNTTLSGPAVAPARLAETGQNQPWLPVVAGGLLLGALGLIRGRRKLKADNA